MSDVALTGLITFVGTVLVALIAGSYSLRNTKREAESSPYAALRDRVLDMEAKLDLLEEKNQTLRVENEELREELKGTNQRVGALEAQSESYRRYIAQVIPWINHHRDVAKSPPPEPSDWWGIFPTHRNI